MADNLESDKGRPLTSEENAEIRELLEKDKRVTWIWTTLRVWATWISTIIAAYLIAKSFIKDLFTQATK